MLDMGRDRLLADQFHKLAELQGQALFALLLANEGTPEHAHALANHAYRELVLLLEVVHNLLQRRVILELKAIP